MTCSDDCKECKRLGKILFELNPNCYQGCCQGMYLTNSESDKYGAQYIEIYQDYYKKNLNKEMKFIFPDHKDLVSDVITDIAENLYILYDNAKNKTVFKNKFLFELQLIKYYTLNENETIKDMHFFNISDEQSKIIEKYLTRLGIIYTPAKRAVRILLRILITRILKNKEIMNEMTEKIHQIKNKKENPDDFIIEIYTKKYINKIIDYFSALN